MVNPLNRNGNGKFFTQIAYPEQKSNIEGGVFSSIGNTYKDKG